MQGLPVADSTLPLLADHVDVPAYDRAALRPSIVHLGVGGFHRSHQAVYLDDLAGAGISMDWGVIGVGLRSEKMKHALGPQDHLFTLLERSRGEDRARVIGSMTGYLFAPDDPARVVAVLSDPRTRLVTVTVTGNGYCIDLETGALDEDDPAVRRDLVNPGRPETVAGYLVEALRIRRAAGRRPFAVVSCDNVPANGKVARQAVMEVARRRDPALAAWIAAEVSFPSTVVDRITPATTTETRAFLTSEFQVRDRWPVVAEPYAQWIVEDDFGPGGRPPLEEVGVRFVADAAPYELIKKRMLNGGHCALGYLGYLAGHRQTDEAMGAPQIHEFIDGLMREEIAPLLPAGVGFDLDAYREELLSRFANPGIGDQLERLCARGSTKMGSYLVPTLVEASERRRPHGRLTIAVAAWMRYLSGVDCDGAPIAVVDPRLSDLQPLARRAAQDPRPLLAACPMFAGIEANERFVTALQSALEALDTGGPSALLEAFGPGEVAVAA